MGTSVVLDESVGPVVALASPASGAVEPSAAVASSVSSSQGVGHGAPYSDTNEGAQSVVAIPTPTAPAAKMAARERRPASTRVGPMSTLAVAPQNGQIASPRLT